MSQKFLISVVLVTSLIALLLYLKDQSTSSSGIDLSFLFFGEFFLENPTFNKLLKKPHQTDSNFRISSAPSCQAYMEYNQRLRTQASKNFTLVDRNILLSRKTDLILFHLAYALDI